MRLRAQNERRARDRRRRHEAAVELVARENLAGVARLDHRALPQLAEEIDPVIDVDGRGGKFAFRQALVPDAFSFPSCSSHIDYWVSRTGIRPLISWKT